MEATINAFIKKLLPFFAQKAPRPIGLNHSHGLACNNASLFTQVTPLAEELYTISIIFNINRS